MTTTTSASITVDHLLAGIANHFWCGGIWPASLLARMAAARQASS